MPGVSLPRESKSGDSCDRRNLGVASPRAARNGDGLREEKQTYTASVIERRNPLWASPIRDAREAPRYSVPEAAHYLDIPSATLSSWVLGRSYVVSAGKRNFEPLIRRPDEKDARLSFWNLIEAHALRALRSKHDVPMRHVRTALAYAGKEYGIERLLLSDDLRAMPGELFLQRLDKLVNIGRSGQEALKELLETFLQRIDRDLQGIPLRLFPFTRPLEQVTLHDVPRVVLIDPKLGSGRPVLMRKAIRTATIADRFGAGESVSALAADYDLGIADIEEAIRYERPKFLAA
ncbi:MAG: DUF433 domain-containing protein [Thermoanaerobaculia bacterium]